MVKGRFGLYWMQAAQRAHWNHALEYAIELANDQGIKRKFRIDAYVEKVTRKGGIMVSSDLMVRLVRNFPALVLLCMLAVPAAAKKTDVITMDTGKVFVGEIKKMEYGLLELSMDEVRSRLQIKWDHVVRVTSTKQLSFDLSNGGRLFGSLVESSADGVLKVKTSLSELEVPRSRVVLFEPIKSSFSRRFSADISTGISYTKSTDITQFNIGGSARHRTDRKMTQLTFSSIVTRKDGATSANGEIPLTHYRFFEGAWFYRGDLGASHNAELGIDFRGMVGAGMGRRLLHSNNAMIQVSSVVTANREYTNDDQRTNNIELVIDTGLLLYRYDSPKVDIDVRLAGFLNLTTWGRYRVNTNVRFSLELIKGLFWDVGQVYFRYDSDPSGLAASKSDWGLVSGLRYKYN